MDKPLEQLFANIEIVIRHLLSGIAIYAIYLLSLSNPCSNIEFLTKEPLLVLFIVGAAGFVAYSLYRIIFWAVGDAIAYCCKWSSTAHASGSSYAAKYAKVLAWRRGKDFDKSLSTYLHYRWAVVHFNFIFASVLLFANFHSEKKSIIDTWPIVAWPLAVISFVVAVWQASVLYRVDGELYEDRKLPTVANEAQPCGQPGATQ